MSHFDFRQAAISNRLYWVALKVIDLILMRPFIFDHLRKRGIQVSIDTIPNKAIFIIFHLSDVQLCRVFQVFFWVFNDKEGFARGYELGATGVMTDCPTLLQTYLKHNPHIVTSRKQGANID